ncbi:MAG: hypothetical protein AAF558_15005, partial [Verrucomicrobiota bacterium]
MSQPIPQDNDLTIGRDEFDETSSIFAVRRKGSTQTKALESALEAAERKAAGGRPYEILEQRTYAEQNYWVGFVKGRFESKPSTYDYRALRLITGSVAFLLPVISWFFYSWGYFWKDIPSSISITYHSPQCTAFFVGCLFIVFTSLFCYKGRSGWETFFSRFAGVAAAGVALFPTSTALETLHFVCAALLFAILIYFCFGPFPNAAISKIKKDLPEFRNTRFYQRFSVIIKCLWPKDPDTRIDLTPARRGFVYYVCGTVMVLGILIVLSPQVPG